MSNARTAASVKKGRPDKYRTEYVQQTYKLAMLGYTDKQLADFFGVAVITWQRWKKTHPDLGAAIITGKALADGDVAQSLYKRATGYSHPDTDIRVIDGQIVKTELIRHYPPDTVACIFWLKNRQREIWRDKPKDETTQTPLSDILDIVRKSANRQ